MRLKFAKGVKCLGGCVCGCMHVVISHMIYTSVWLKKVNRRLLSYFLSPIAKCVLGVGQIFFILWPDFLWVRHNTIHDNQTTGLVWEHAYKYVMLITHLFRYIFIHRCHWEQGEYPSHKSHLSSGLQLVLMVMWCVFKEHTCSTWVIVKAAELHEGSCAWFNLCNVSRAPSEPPSSTFNHVQRSAAVGKGRDCRRKQVHTSRERTHDQTRTHVVKHASGKLQCLCSYMCTHRYTQTNI